MIGYISLLYAECIFQTDRHCLVRMIQDVHGISYPPVTVAVNSNFLSLSSLQRLIC